MESVIRILPESVSNQIAAGEVVQRPSSVVKELVENSIDAGANNIFINVKDAGKTLIQVIDNGCGMSPQDARLCFERHATSKIKTAEDLFHITTKGFRGEALASIASVAQVDLKTKHLRDNIGTYIQIEGGHILKEEPLAWKGGTSISVKNLFFNVPARRKFLKSDKIEWNHIMEEIIRIAIVHPSITFRITHNDVEVATFSSAPLRQRLTNIFGEKINEKLVPIETHTDLVRITGFIGKPEYSKKHRSEQFFFANSRYIRAPYFHHAVMSAYEDLLPEKEYPAYFIFLECPPDKIDVNIHPTKTEVKFEEERAIYQILHTTVRQSIGKFNLLPPLTFETEVILQEVNPPSEKIKIPTIRINPDYNPFRKKEDNIPGRALTLPDYEKKDALEKTKEFYQHLSLSVPETGPTTTSPSTSLFAEDPPSIQDFIVYRQSHFIFEYRQKLLCVNRYRAHVRILYEKIIQNLSTKNPEVQKLLFPETIELSIYEAELILQKIDLLHDTGFDIAPFGQRQFVIHGIPAFLHNTGIKDLFDEMLKEINILKESNVRAGRQIALLLSQKSAVKNGTVLTKEENQAILEAWIQTEDPMIYPAGGKTAEEIKIENF